MALNGWRRAEDGKATVLLKAVGDTISLKGSAC
jgi:hypothetical protein